MLNSFNLNALLQARDRCKASFSDVRLTIFSGFLRISSKFELQMTEIHTLNPR